jgi:RNA polymerase sigma-70 factor (ECF subfamily)
MKLLKSAMNDFDIVELSFQRDERAITETDAKYGKYLFSVAYNIVHDRLDCEECLNDTYLDAWNAMPPERPAALKAFLAIIMRRRAIDRYKAEKRKKRIPSELTVSLSELEFALSDDTPQSELEAEELCRIISDFLRSLPERRAYIFMSRYYAARPIREIANKLCVSESTINKELAAIRQDLRKMLEGEGYFI